MYIFNDGRCIIFLVCYNNINVKDNDDDIFIWILFDNKIGFFVEDCKFVVFMDVEFYKDIDGFWFVLLFFKELKLVMFNNYL